MPGASNGVLYVTNPNGGETVAPWNTAGNNYPDTEICQEVTCTSGVPTGTPWYTSASASAAYAASPQLAWKWARVTWKTNKTAGSSDLSSVDGTTSGNGVCWNGFNEITTSSGCPGNSLPVYELTVLAIAPGGSRRVVQYEVTMLTSPYPPLPGSLTFDGPTPNFSSPHSNPFHINGQDQASPACPPAGDKPAIAGYDDASVTTLTGDLNRPDHYSGVPPGGSSPVAPSVSNTGPTATPPANTLGVLGTVSGLQGLVNSVTGVADQIVPSNGTPPLGLGTADNPLVTVVQGDFAPGPVHGYGVLLVEGNATFDGNFSWDGEILIIGNGSMTFHGGGNGRINGGVFVANINSGTSGSTPGPPTVDWNGGGGNGIYYNSCLVNSLNNRLGGGYFRAIAGRELMF